MNVEQWKYKFLFPFGNIAPIADKDEISTDNNTNNDKVEGEPSNKSFNRLVSKKYLFPLELIHKPEWLKEL